MATIKSYTDLNQSRKLAEILPIESADMCYVQDLLGGGKYGDYKPYIGDLIPAYGQDKIKCWSLAALLGVLPTVIGSVFEKNALRLRMDKSESDFNIWYDNLDTGDVAEGFDVIADNPVDACYEMIIRLNELKML